jgi:hypothetical protein
MCFASVGVTLTAPRKKLILFEPNIFFSLPFRYRL